MVSYTLTNPISGDNVDVYYWSCIEIATAIVCTCLPALRVLMSQWCSTMFGSLQSHTIQFTPSGGSHLNIGNGRDPMEDSESGDKTATEDPREDQNAVDISEIGARFPNDSEGTDLVKAIHKIALVKIYRER